MLRSVLGAGDTQAGVVLDLEGQYRQISKQGSTGGVPSLPGVILGHTNPRPGSSAVAAPGSND